jgi:catechol 2,3-dioxygenase-like lactoylglutathione lyase family enzyme
MDKPLVFPQRTNTILYCRYWADSVHFYREKLRLLVTFENAWLVEFQLTGSAYVSIADSSRTSIQDVRGQGITLTWKVADLEQAKERLEAQGITTTAVRRRWGALVFYCHDPEGHRLEFWADEEQKGGGSGE